MKELFKQQLEESVLLTEESIAKLMCKEYYNGEEIKAGDKILFAMLLDEGLDNKRPSYTCIVLNEKHINDFIPISTCNALISDKDSIIPIIKLK